MICCFVSSHMSTFDDHVVMCTFQVTVRCGTGYIPCDGTECTRIRKSFNTLIHSRSLLSFDFYKCALTSYTVVARYSFFPWLCACVCVVIIFLKSFSLYRLIISFLIYVCVCVFQELVVMTLVGTVMYRLYETMVCRGVC